MNRLVKCVRAQESQVQVLDSMEKLTLDEPQLQSHLDTLSYIMDLKKKLSDAEDKHHIITTNIKVLQEEAACSQKHAATLVSESRNGLVKPKFLPPTLPNLSLLLLCDNPLWVGSNKVGTTTRPSHGESHSNSDGRSMIVHMLNTLLYSQDYSHICCFMKSYPAHS